MFTFIATTLLCGMALALFIMNHHQKAAAEGKLFYKDTDSEIIIDKKEQDADFKKVWIIAHDPNNNTGHLKIIVNDQNTWNLIRVNERYFASYEKKASYTKMHDTKTPYHLKQIVFPNNPDHVPLR
jgi:hypothetical protein